MAVVRRSAFSGLQIDSLLMSSIVPASYCLKPARRLLVALSAVTTVKSEAQTPPTGEPPTVMQLESTLDLAPIGIWENGLGQGFRHDAQSVTISAGATYGLAEF